jgi:histone H3/H4
VLTQRVQRDAPSAASIDPTLEAQRRRVSLALRQAGVEMRRLATFSANIDPRAYVAAIDAVDRDFARAVATAGEQDAAQEALAEGAEKAKREADLIRRKTVGARDISTALNQGREVAIGRLSTWPAR